MPCNRTVSWTGEYRAGVVLIYYRREGEHEELHIPGPTLEDLRFLVRENSSGGRFFLFVNCIAFVQLLFRETNPGVSYEYTVPNENMTRTPEFRWEYTDWSVCTATCGGGTQVSPPKCLE